jgi:hypothetical protein
VQKYFTRTIELSFRKLCTVSKLGDVSGFELTERDFFCWLIRTGKNQRNLGIFRGSEEEAHSVKGGQTLIFS